MGLDMSPRGVAAGLTVLAALLLSAPAAAREHQ